MYLFCGSVAMTFWFIAISFGYLTTRVKKPPQFIFNLRQL